MQAAHLPRHTVDHPHGVEVGEGPLAAAQPAGQQLDDALRRRGSGSCIAL